MHTCTTRTKSNLQTLSPNKFVPQTPGDWDTTQEEATQPPIFTQSRTLTHPLGLLHTPSQTHTPSHSLTPSHTHPHPHTSSHALTHPLSHPLTPTLTHPHTPSCALSHHHAPSQILTEHPCTDSNPHPHPHAQPQRHTHTHSLTHPHTHPRSHPRSPSYTPSLKPSHTCFRTLTHSSHPLTPTHNHSPTTPSTYTPTYVWLTSTPIRAPPCFNACWGPQGRTWGAQKNVPESPFRARFKQIYNKILVVQFAFLCGSSHWRAAFRRTWTISRYWSTADRHRMNASHC